MFLGIPPSFVTTKLVRDSAGTPECSIAVVECDVHAIICKPNEIKFAISRHVHNKARVLGDAPALVIAEEGEDLFGRLESAIPVVIRDVNVMIPESNDVKESVSVEIGEEAQVLFRPPPSAVSKIPHSKFRWGERPISVVQRHEDTLIRKSHNICATGVSDIRHKPGVPCNQPSARLIRKVADDQLGGTEGVVAIVLRDPDAGIAEADDVEVLVAGCVSEEPYVSVDPPATGVICEALECVTFLDVKAISNDRNSSQSETNNVCCPGVSNGD